MGAITLEFLEWGGLAERVRDVFSSAGTLL